MNDAFLMLERAGYLHHLHEMTCEDGTLHARADIALISKLRGDLRFRKSWLHHLHRRIPKPRIEFRSFHGEIDPAFTRSVQVVFCKTPGSDGRCEMEADIDGNNPNESVVRFIGHTADVVMNYWKKLNA